MGSAVVTSERTEEALTWVSDPSCVLQSINKTDFNPLLALGVYCLLGTGVVAGGKIHTKYAPEYLGSLQPPLSPARRRGGEDCFWLNLRHQGMSTTATGPDRPCKWVRELET